MSLGEFYKKLYDDDKYDEAELEHEKMRLKTGLMIDDTREMKGIPQNHE